MPWALETAAVAEALAQKRLRLELSAALPPALDAARLWAAVWRVVRARHARPTQTSEDELFQVTAIAPEADGWVVGFRYVFDRDFASQYDATEPFEAEFELRGDAAALRAWRAASP